MRTSIKYVLIFFAFIAIIGLALTLCSNTSATTTYVWDGESTSPLASNATNWYQDIDGAITNDIAPEANGNIVFNTTSIDVCTWNLDSDSFGQFSILAGYTGTITQSSEMYISGFTMGDGIFLFANEVWVYCSGDFIRTAGSITGNHLCLNISAGTINVGSTDIRQLQISGTVHYDGTPTTIITYKFINNAGAELILDDGTLQSRYYTGLVYINNGSISGTGSFQIYLYSNPSVINFGNISCPLWIHLQSGATGSITLKTGSNTNLLNTLLINSAHATYKCILDIAGYDLTATNTALGVRGVLLNSAGTNATITCMSFDSSNALATFTGTNIDLILMGTGDLKLKADEAPNNLTFSATAITTFYGNVWVTSSLMIMDGSEIVQGSYYLNVSGIDCEIDFILNGTFTKVNYNGTGAGVGYAKLPMNGWLVSDQDIKIITSSGIFIAEPVSELELKIRNFNINMGRINYYYNSMGAVNYQIEMLPLEDYIIMKDGHIFDSKVRANDTGYISFTMGTGIGEVSTKYWSIGVLVDQLNVMIYSIWVLICVMMVFIMFMAVINRFPKK